MTQNLPTKAELLAAKNTTLRDVIAPDLQLLFCGINPGLYTAAIGHHFGRPGNRFWKTLYEAGFTDRLFSPYEDMELLKNGYGITNIVARATNTAAEVSEQEFIAGGKVFEEKVIKYKPKWVAFVGIGAYRYAFQKPKAQTGRQAGTIADAKIWLLPSTSGLNANYRPKDLTEMFRQLLFTIKQYS